jgi:ferritin-like metal-binding protein YciE
MALFSMKLETLQNLFVEQLRDLYDGEQQITKALPKMIEKANHNDLKDALQEHLDVTREQIRRLDQIFNMLGEKASGETCKGMKGVIAEGEGLMSDAKDSSVLDAGIIASAQRVEHYEIAGYGTVRTYATLLGRKDIAELLQQTLEEEKEADQALNDIAESVNIEAKAA